MTARMKNLIYEHYKRGHVIAQGIKADEINNLVNNLRFRLHDSGDELDFSPESLVSLYKMLLLYCQQVGVKDCSFPDQENIQIIREIASYFGSVILRNKGGKWENPGGLLNLGISYHGNFEAIKGGKVKKQASIVQNLGYLAAGIWEGAIMGLNIDIMEYYKMFSQKRLKERLGRKNRNSKDELAT